VITDFAKVLLEESEIHRRLDVLALEITRDYEGKPLTVVAILNGSFIFMADLLRRIPLDLHVESLSVSSYHGTESSGRIDFRQTRFADLRGRHVLVLDDILDTGRTLHAVTARLADGTGAASIRTCVLLQKNVARVCDIEADYVGFDIPDEFVVGYGLDYNERYRTLPFIGVLNDDAIHRGGLSSDFSND